jgi:WD40 repeat protein
VGSSCSGGYFHIKYGSYEFIFEEIYEYRQHERTMMQPVVIKDLNLHNKGVKSCRWSGDGRYLGTSSTAEKNTKISQLEPSGTIKSIQTIPNSQGIYQVVWNPTDSQHFALTGQDKFVEMWDVRAPRASAKIAVPSGTNDYASWSPDGRCIGAVNANGVFTVVDTRAGKCIADMKFATEVHICLARMLDRGVSPCRYRRYSPLTMTVD